jgi:hypothetical protein
MFDEESGRDMAASYCQGIDMTHKSRHWLAIAAILGLMVFDHLPERAPELIMAAWNGAPASEWDSLPMMYE